MTSYFALHALVSPQQQQQQHYGPLSTDKVLSVSLSLSLSPPHFRRRPPACYWNEQGCLRSAGNEIVAVVLPLVGGRERGAPPLQR